MAAKTRKSSRTNKEPSQPSLTQPTLFDVRQPTRNASTASPHAGMIFNNTDIEYHSPLTEDNPMASISRSIESSVRRISSELRRIEIDFEKAIEFTNARVAALEQNERKTDTKIKALEKRIAELESANETNIEAVNKQERFSRRNNIRIVGYDTTPDENCIEIATEVLRKVGVENVRIERAHRDGFQHENRSRHILVRLSFYQDKITALKFQRQKLQNCDFFIIDDLTKIDLKEKRKWNQQVSDLYSRGTKLRFSAGKWRDHTGKPFSFS